MSQFNQTFITLIIDRYNLELDDYLLGSIVVTWLQQYDSDWIVKAIVESIHRGRYKVKSVDSILIGWQRLGKPAYKFTAEFEREILQNLPVIPDSPEDLAPETSSVVDPELSIVPPAPINLNSDDLNPEESAPFQHHNHSISATLAHQIQTQSIVEATEYSGFDTLLATSLASLQNPSYFDFAAVDASVDRVEVVTNRIVTQPAKFQLFRTLKAIVGPNYLPAPATVNLDCVTLSNDAHLPPVANFKFSLGSASGE